MGVAGMVVALATQPCVGCLPARMFACMPYLAVVKRWAGLLLHRTCDTVQALSRRLISIFPLPTCGCECTCITRFGDLSAHLPTHTAQSTRQLQSLRFEDSAQMLDAAGTPTPLTPHLSSADQSGPAFLRFVPDRQHVLLAASRAGILRTYNLTTLRAVGPASLVNCRANFMDADSGSLCCMSQVSESGNVVLFGDTNGGVHSWSTESSASQHPDAGNGSKQGVGPLNAMVWEPEPRPEPTKVGHRSEILLELSGGNGGAGLSFQQQQQKRLERPPLVPPRCTSPGSALAFLQHLQLSEFPQCLSDSMLEAAKRELLPRSGLPIVRIRPDLLNAQQRPSNTLAFIDNRKWELPRNGFIYQTDPKLQGYVSHLDPRGDLSAQNSPASGSAGDATFFAAAASFRLPQPWQRQRIDVSKLRFGFDGFDFGRFNKTMFAGLENLLPDSYINSIIQMVYHIPSVRDALLRHVCGRTGCLACELGFLFDMLDQARGLPPRRRSVQATNFLGALRLKPTTKILGLLKETYAGDMDDGAAALAPNRMADTTQYGAVANAALAPSIGAAAVTAEDGADYLNLRAGKFLSFLMAQLQDDSSYQPPKHVKDFSNSLMLQSGDPGSAANDSAEAAEVMNVIHSRFGFEADIRSTCRRNHVQVVSVPVLEVDLTYDGLLAGNSATNGSSGVQAPSARDSFKEADTSVAAAIMARSGPGALETGAGDTTNRAAQPKSVFTFADILEASLCPRKSTQAWCNGCKKYVPLQQRSCPSSLPEILLVNCNISSERLRQEFWVNHPNCSTTVNPVTAAAAAASRAAAAAERGVNPRNSHDVPNLVVPPLLELEVVEPIDSAKQGNSDSPPAVAGEGKVRVRATDAAHLDAAGRHDSNATNGDGGFTTPKRNNKNHRHQAKAGRSKNRATKSDASRKDGGECDTSAGKTRRRVYELRVIVSHIREKHSDTLSDGHLVTHVRPFVRPADAAAQEQSADGGGVPAQTTPTKAKRAASAATSDAPSSASAGLNQDWYIFNDFYVAKQDVRDVFNFRNDWRTCCLLAYVERDACVAIDQVLQQRPASISPLKEQVFEPCATPLALKHGNLESTQVPSTPLNSAMQALAVSAGSDTPSREASGAFAFRSSPQQLRRSKVVVDLNDLPGRGDPVAIDCEFVSLADEDTFISAEGRRVVHREAQLGLGRVSCLDGRGTETGKCFIDDYIINNEPIVDYLTRFSGLKPGDLDPATSQHHLVTLKIAYLKLRHLVQRGCIFIGHGLKKDFRIINMLVPACQIQDTVELFYQQNNRRISLRFLAAYLLKQDIQSDNHDSIQDARTALLCYRRYLELRESGKLASTIQDIYNQGYKTKWKEVNGITVT
eukprot:INCI6178.4.p1 GENE.INCI6178.4~~INCI6178.4.p1  ORF type:complete len:1357 (-),score=217.14 INCI6178.4:1524-5594(-)